MPAITATHLKGRRGPCIPLPRRDNGRGYISGQLRAEPQIRGVDTRRHHIFVGA
jgi:hypothetical protein